MDASRIMIARFLALLSDVEDDLREASEILENHLIDAEYRLELADNAIAHALGIIEGASTLLEVEDED